VQFRRGLRTGFACAIRELEQIQFLLGHASVQTTERYLGCKQNLGHPVNDLFYLGADAKPNEPSPQLGLRFHDTSIACFRPILHRELQ
jgi:hypothetical protein